MSGGQADDTGTDVTGGRSDGESGDGTDVDAENMGAGIAIGIALGVALGAAFDDAALGIAIGIALGVAIGTGMSRTGSEED